MALIASGIVVVAVASVAIGLKIKGSRWTSGKKHKWDGAVAGRNEKLVAYVGEQGYANVRSSPELKQISMSALMSDWGFYKDSLFLSKEELQKKYASNNLIGKVTSGKIGDVVSDSTGGRGYVWFRVKLATPIKGKTSGYIREDVVDIKKEPKD